MKDQVSEYVPGICNLDSGEIRTRFLIGVVGVLLTALLTFILLRSEVVVIWRVIVFLLAMVGTLGFVQAFSRFCVLYGFLGIPNVRKSHGEQDTDELAECRIRDRRTALRLLRLAAVIAACVTVGVICLP